MSPRMHTTSVAEKAKPALLPKLRFSEFRGAEVWYVKSFQKLFTIGSGRDYKHLSKGLVPVYGSGGYMLSVDDFLYEGESVCIGRKGTINNPMFLTGKFWTVDTLFYTHSFQQCLPKFIYAIFQNIEWLKHNEAGGVPSLSKRIIEKIQTAVPDIPEQQKIADCLGSLDELIAAQARKVEALKTHKKGLMQQLFPREGETQPRLRFPEYQSTGTWQKRKVSSLLARSVSPVRVEPEEKYREIGIRSHGRGIFHKEPLLGKALGEKRVFYVEESAFVLNIVFAWEQAVAVTSVAERGMIASHRFPMYKPNEREADVVFIKYFFLTDKGKELLGIASPGGAGRNKTLGQKDFEKLEFLCPRKVEEQTAIALCLSSADALITAATQKLDNLKTHKKGLMQQLFPSSEALEV
jgi:type I restriction enzyme S subunit